MSQNGFQVVSQQFDNDSIILIRYLKMTDGVCIGLGFAKLVFGFITGGALGAFYELEPLVALLTAIIVALSCLLILPPNSIISPSVPAEHHKNNLKNNCNMSNLVSSNGKIEHNDGGSSSSRSSPKLDRGEQGPSFDPTLLTSISPKSSNNNSDCVIKGDTKETQQRFLDTSKPTPTSKRIKFMVKWADLKLASLPTNDYPSTIIIMDDVVSELSLVVEAVKKLKVGLDENEQKLGAFVKLVERVDVYKRYQKANNVWFKLWDGGQGKVRDADAWLRFQFVFPTIINIAKILAATNLDVHRTSHAEYKELVAQEKIVSNAINHIADWCYKVLTSRNVQRFLQKYESRLEQDIRKSGGASGSPPLKTTPQKKLYYPPEGAELEVDVQELDLPGKSVSTPTKAGEPFQTPSKPTSNKSNTTPPSSVMSSKENCAINSKIFPKCHKTMKNYDSEKHKWGESALPEAIRGPNYLVDKKKIKGSAPYLELLGMDIFSSKTEQKCYAKHVNSYVNKFRKAGEKRFLVICAFRFPPENLISIYAVPDGVTPPKLFTDFVTKMDDKERNKRFKIIPNVINGPWLVRSAVGGSPAIIGKALEVNYYQKPDDWFEISCNVFSSTTAKYILKVVKGASKKLVIDLGFCIEAQTKEELPEQYMCGSRIIHADMNKARSID